MTSCDRSHMRPLVRIFDTASQGISPASSVHPGGPLLLATTNAQAPSADMLSALDDTSMLQHLNRGHRARNEHRAASPTINSRSYGAYKILTVVQAAAAGTFSSSPDPQRKAVQAFHSSEERLLRGARRGPNASRDQR